MFLSKKGFQRTFNLTCKPIRNHGQSSESYFICNHYYLTKEWLTLNLYIFLIYFFKRSIIPLCILIGNSLHHGFYLCSSEPSFCFRFQMHIAFSMNSYDSKLRSLSLWSPYSSPLSLTDRVKLIEKFYGCK